MIGLRLFLSDSLPLIQLHEDFQIHVGQGYIVIGSRKPLQSKDDLNNFFIKLSDKYGHLFHLGSYNDHILSVGAVSFVTEPVVQDCHFPTDDDASSESASASSSDSDSDTDEWTYTYTTDTASSYSDSDSDDEDYSQNQFEDATTEEDSLDDLDILLQEIEQYRNENNVLDSETEPLLPKASSIPLPPPPPSSPLVETVTTTQPLDIRNDQDSLRRIWQLSRKLQAM